MSTHALSTATIEELLDMAAEEAMHACEALPPHVEFKAADPMHASACALRAYELIRLAQKRVKGGTDG